MNTQLYFLIKRLCDLEQEFSELTEEEKEIVISGTEDKIGSLATLLDAMEDYCVETFLDSDD